MSQGLKVGGPVDAQQYVYIEREDSRLLQLLLEGEYANVLTSRQMGKTSLTFRTMTALGEHGVRTVYMDLAAAMPTTRRANGCNASSAKSWIPRSPRPW